MMIVPMFSPSMIYPIADGIIMGYIGPGASAGAIAILLGIIGSVLLAIFSVLWYPFKRLLRGWRRGRVDREDAAPLSKE